MTVKTYASKNERVPSSDLEAQLQRFPLERWLQRHAFVPQGRLRQEYVAACCWCGTDDKLSVNIPKRRGRCFVCQHPFELIDLIAQFEGGYAQAVQVVQLASGGRSISLIPEDELHAPDVAIRDPRWEPWPIRPPQHFEPLTAHHPYTARRNFDFANLLRLGTGICTWGTYQDRLVFPVRRPYDGEWLYFQTRATWERVEHVADTKYRKNLNPPNGDPSRYASSSDVLLGLEHAWGSFTRIAIVEGPTDWLQSGPDAVATFGKVISDRHIQLLIRAGITDVDLCYDPDAWEHPTTLQRDGRHTPNLKRPPPARQAADKLAQHFITRVVRYPPGTDPGSFSPEQNHGLRRHAQLYGDGARLAFIP